MTLSIAKFGTCVMVLKWMLATTVLAQSGSDVQELAPGVISTGRGFTVTLSPDNKDAYFTVRE